MVSTRVKSRWKRRRQASRRSESHKYGVFAEAARGKVSFITLHSSTIPGRNDLPLTNVQHREVQNGRIQIEVAHGSPDIKLMLRLWHGSDLLPQESVTLSALQRRLKTHRRPTILRPSRDWVQ